MCVDFIIIMYEKQRFLAIFMCFTWKQQCCYQCYTIQEIHWILLQDMRWIGGEGGVRMRISNHIPYRYKHCYIFSGAAAAMMGYLCVVFRQKIGRGLALSCVWMLVKTIENVCVYMKSIFTQIYVLFAEMCCSHTHTRAHMYTMFSLALYREQSIHIMNIGKHFSHAKKHHLFFLLHNKCVISHIDIWCINKVV